MTQSPNKPAKLCPICKGPRGTRPSNRFAPFCTQRCKLIDLGRWLGDSYAIPGPPSGFGDG